MILPLDQLYLFLTFPLSPLASHNSMHDNSQQSGISLQKPSNEGNSNTFNMDWIFCVPNMKLITHLSGNMWVIWYILTSTAKAFPLSIQI